jgi:hypothetical protein
MAVMDQEWLLKEHWSNVNNTIAGINQLLQDADYKPIILTMAKTTGVSYIVDCLLSSLQNKKLT